MSRKAPLDEEGPFERASDRTSLSLFFDCVASLPLRACFDPTDGARSPRTPDGDEGVAGLAAPDELAVCGSRTPIGAGGTASATIGAPFDETDTGGGAAAASELDPGATETSSTSGISVSAVGCDTGAVEVSTEVVGAVTDGGTAASLLATSLGAVVTTLTGCSVTDALESADGAPTVASLA